MTKCDNCGEKIHNTIYACDCGYYCIDCVVIKNDKMYCPSCGEEMK
jgi:uncharacterized protein (UPF0212 family)